LKEWVQKASIKILFSSFGHSFILPSVQRASSSLFYFIQKNIHVQVQILETAMIMFVPFLPKIGQRSFSNNLNRLQLSLETIAANHLSKLTKSKRLSTLAASLE